MKDQRGPADTSGMDPTEEYWRAVADAIATPADERSDAEQRFWDDFPETMQRLEERDADE